MKHFDALIIGTGQGGTPLAKALAKAGHKTAVVERHFVGGSCVNYGCTPTKTMIASAKTAYMITKAGSLGIEANGFRVNMPAVVERKAKVVESFRNGSQKGLESTENLSLFFGEASFEDKKRVRIALREGGTEAITADKIFINTGARPAVPPVEGLEEAGYLTSTSVMELTEIPEHLLVIGGGYIGLEFGQMFRRFGSRVTILQTGDRLLTREDEDISAEVEKILKAEDIGILTNVQAEKVEKQPEGLLVTVAEKDEIRTVQCSHILVAAGRIPDTDRLNLSAAGAETGEKGEIRVNEKLETTAAGIYAMGDVKGGPAFTHISYHDYVILAGNLLHQKNDTIKDRLVPYCVFIDPQLGEVGLTEQAARERGLNIKIAKLPMSHVARAIETGDTRGMMKAIVDADSGKILGATILAQEGGEIMTVLQMAIAGGLHYRQIRDMPIAHPLYAESLNNLFMQLD